MVSVQESLDTGVFFYYAGNPLVIAVAVVVLAIAVILRVQQGVGIRVSDI